jgi:hypothetical protein
MSNKTDLVSHPKTLEKSQIYGRILQDMGIIDKYTQHQFDDGSVLLFQTRNYDFRIFFNIEDGMDTYTIKAHFLPTEHMHFKKTINRVQEFVDTCKWYADQYRLYANPDLMYQEIVAKFPCASAALHLYKTHKENKEREAKVIADMERDHEDVMKEVARQMREEADRIENGDYRVLHSFRRNSEDDFFAGIEVRVSDT